MVLPTMSGADAKLSRQSVWPITATSWASLRLEAIVERKAGAEHRSNANRRKEAARDELHLRFSAVAVARVERNGVADPADDRREDVSLPGEVAKLQGGERPRPPASSGVEFLLAADRDQRVVARYARRRAHRHRLDEREDAGLNADPNRQHDDDRRRGQRRAREVPQREPDITFAHVALVVRLRRAIAFFTQVLDFTLVEDTYQAEQNKRWVLVAPRGSTGTSILLARPSQPGQDAFIGNQTGGRVTFFLRTDDFWRDFDMLRSRGVEFARAPMAAPYRNGRRVQGFVREPVGSGRA